MSINPINVRTVSVIWRSTGGKLLSLYVGNLILLTCTIGKCNYITDEFTQSRSKKAWLICDKTKINWKQKRVWEEKKGKDKDYRKVMRKSIRIIRCEQHSTFQIPSPTWKLDEAQRERTLLITANMSVLFWKFMLLLSIDNLISQLVTGMFACTLSLMVVCVWLCGTQWSV